MTKACFLDESSCMLETERFPPMNVAIIAPLNLSTPGGLEGYTRRLAAGLAARGFGGRVAMPDCDLWNTRTKRLLPLMTRSKLRSFAQSYASRAGRREAEALIEGANVVHFIGTGWHLLGFALQQAAHRRGLPITCWPAVHPGSWGDAPLDIDLYKRLDAVFVQSDYERDHLNRLGVPREKLVRCGCAAPADTSGDGERFRQQYRLGDRPLVLFVGRKDRGKGYHTLREAIGALAAAGERVTLVSIGRPVEPPYPELPSAVDLDLGMADDPSKHNAIAACDVFALPSEAESFGIVYIEAWAYGKPVLCGTAPASRELVTRHDGGLLSDGTAVDVASQLKRLLRDPAERHRQGEAGRQAVKSNYSIERILETHCTVWERLKDNK